MFNHYSNNYFNNYFKKNYSNKTVTHQIQKGDCLMEMRKFIVELHTDGSMTWNEYEEPKSIKHDALTFTHEEWKHLLDEVFCSICDGVDKTYPGCSWSEDDRLLYKAGASALVNLVKDVF